VPVRSRKAVRDEALRAPVVAFPGICHLASPRGRVRPLRSLRVSLLHAPRRRAALFDHFMGRSQKRWWNYQPERVGRFEVDCELERRRRLNWQVCRIGASEDFIVWIR
jgi:hypothetical protein